MAISVNTFLRNYSSAIIEGNAALFIGAGMSRAGGFVDWKGFVTPFADELGIELDEEKDLVAVAQYYLNSKNGERSFLNQALLDEFDRPGAFTPSHELIVRLRIPMIWTTNYDKLIEDAFQRAGKYVDVKLRDKDIGFSRRRCAAVLYKMHGDISQPDKVVICKEDYERYQRTHPVFQNTLTTALLGKTFLFLGLSFDDPNLNYTLGHLCSLLENKKRVHYVLMRDVRREGEWNESKTKFRFTEEPESFDFRQRRQSLVMGDLQRYGVETVLLERFSEVAQILRLLDLRVKLFEHLTKLHPILSEKQLNEILDKHITHRPN